VANLDHNVDWFEPSDESLALVCEITRHADAALFVLISYKLLDDYWSHAHQNLFSKTIKKGDSLNSIIIADDIKKKSLSYGINMLNKLWMVKL